MFENGKSVMYMIFDGKNTNYMSWFSYSKFLESNYDDLYNDGCFYKFQFTKFVSIIYIPPYPISRFFSSEGQKVLLRFLNSSFVFV